MTKANTAKLLSFEHIHNDKREYERRCKMSALMFEPITDETEINATLQGRSGKGENEAFLNNAETAYQDYIKKNPGGHFILPLNEREGAKFFGKNTDSLYASLHSVITKKELKTTWRLVRVKKSDDNGNSETFLRLVHL